MTNTLSLSAININARGNKAATLSDENQRLVATFDEPARCLFGPSTFDKDESAAHQGVPFEPTQELSEFFTRLDVWAKAYIEQESERLFLANNSHKSRPLPHIDDVEDVV